MWIYNEERGLCVFTGNTVLGTKAVDHMIEVQ